MAAMGPPGGGRNPVTMRLMRHFHYVSFTEMEFASKVFSLTQKEWHIIYTKYLNFNVLLIVLSLVFLYEIESEMKRQVQIELARSNGNE